MNFEPKFDFFLQYVAISQLMTLSDGSSKVLVYQKQAFCNFDVVI